MTSPAGWLMGMKEAARRRTEIQEELRAKHLRIMKARRRFAEVFGVDVKAFYDGLFLGFDLCKFDDWLRANVEAYDEDKESMAEFISRRYGPDAAKLVESLV